MYRTILIKNGEYKKTLHRCKTRENAFINFRRIKDENKSVLFPKRFINYNGIKEVEYKICVVKDTEDGDEFRLVKDKLGKVSKESPLFDIWTVLDDSEYNIEESFWLYGRDPKTDRVKIQDIVKLIMVGAYKKKMTKEVIVVNNKLVIYNEEQFDMVICKCIDDAQRLHHALSKAIRKNKIKSIVFMGTATEASMGRMYDIIKVGTGWPMTKIWRTTTRP